MPPHVLTSVKMYSPLAICILKYTLALGFRCTGGGTPRQTHPPHARPTSLSPLTPPPPFPHVHYVDTAWRCADPRLSSKAINDLGCWYNFEFRVFGREVHPDACFNFDSSDYCLDFRSNYYHASQVNRTDRIANARTPAEAGSGAFFYAVFSILCRRE